jgi:hypothetical protein
MLGVLAQIPGNADRFPDHRMDEIPMTASSAAIRKSRSFEISD